MLVSVAIISHLESTWPAFLSDDHDFVIKGARSVWKSRSELLHDPRFILWPFSAHGTHCLSHYRTRVANSRYVTCAGRLSACSCFRPMRLVEMQLQRCKKVYLIFPQKYALRGKNRCLSFYP